MRYGKMLSLALICTFFWGLCFPLVKIGSSVFAADGSIAKLLIFAGVRFLLSGGILVIGNSLCRSREAAWHPRGKTLRHAFVLALLLTAVHYTLTYIGLSNCTGSKGAILKQVGVIAVMLLSGFFFPDDRLTLRKLVGCAIGFAGIVVCNIPFDTEFSFAGEGCLILASLVSSAGDLYSRYATQHADAAFLSGWQQLLGGGLLTIVGLLMSGSLDPATPVGLLSLGGLVGASIIAYTLWMYLTKRCNLSHLALLKLTSPLFGIVTSAIILGENLLKWQNWIAMLLITFSLFIVRETSPSHPAYSIKKD